MSKMGYKVLWRHGLFGRGIYVVSRGTQRFSFTQGTDVSLSVTVDSQDIDTMGVVADLRQAGAFFAHVTNLV